MNKRFLPILIIVCLLQVSCSQSEVVLIEETVTLTIEATLSPTTTPSPTATLPPTLTLIPTAVSDLVTPTAIFSQIELSAADEETFRNAQNDIYQYRQGDIQILLQDEDGNPLPGYLVNYNQVSHDFLFGGIADPYYTTRLSEAGINTMTVYMAWDWIQPEYESYSLEFANYWLGIDEIANGKMKVKTNGLYMVNADDMPPYYKNISFDEFLRRLYEHESTIVKRFASSVDYWEAILEPNFGNHNPLNLSKDEYYQAISTSIQAIRDNDLDATVEISIGYPCGGIDWLDNFQIVQEMLNRNIDFDVLGLQFYYNAYIAAGNYQMPRRSISDMSVCYDRYESLLTPYGKKIVGSEFSVPSDVPAGRIGYWGIPWSEDTQAQYLATAYTVFFSKPSNMGLIWWNSVDPSPFVYNGGLIFDNGTPKKSYYTLQSLINGWTTKGEGSTDEKGNVAFRGFGGDYYLEIINPTTGESMFTQVHIIEQDSSSETIKFLSNNKPLERKANLERLVSFWEIKSEEELIQKGNDYIALINHHLLNSEWELADQTLTAALDELEIITEVVVPNKKLIPVGYQFPMSLENGSAIMWGATILHLPYDFPEGTVTVEIMAHSQNEKGESPIMVSGVGSNYSPVWKVDAWPYEIYSFTVDTTGYEEEFTIRFPYDGRIYERITAQGGDPGELKLYIDQVKLIIKSSEVP